MLPGDIPCCCALHGTRHKTSLCLILQLARLLFDGICATGSRYSLGHCQLKTRKPRRKETPHARALRIFMDT
jgi:hypothetical protein